MGDVLYPTAIAIAEGNRAESETRAFCYVPQQEGKRWLLQNGTTRDARGEASRLRRLGSGLVTDSFGEARSACHCVLPTETEHASLDGWALSRILEGNELFAGSATIDCFISLGDGLFKRFGVTRSRK